MIDEKSDPGAWAKALRYPNSIKVIDYLEPQPEPETNETPEEE